VSWDAEVVQPADLTAALGALAERPDLVVMAGGTDLMVGLHAGVFRPKALLDIWGLDELRGISVEDDVVRIGALTTYSDLMRDAVIGQRLPLLAQAATEVGAVQIQNRGTLGGNVVNASPSGDSLPPLAAYEAELELASSRGRRRVPVCSFYTGYKAFDLADDELLCALHVPLPAAGATGWFRKVGTRRAQSISKVVAAALVHRTADGAITDARVAIGAVAPTVLRLPVTEGLLEGATPGGDLVERVRQQVMAEVVPIDDVRSTADYRRQVSGNIVARFVSEL